MKIGPYEIYSLETGRLGLDGGAMFGVVPKTLWSKTNPSDDRNRIDLAMRVLLVLYEDRKILVDAGVGHKFPPKLREIYRLDFSHSTLKSSLARHQLTAEDITDVVVTHCHFDHFGGATETEGEQLRLTFSKAIHYVQRSHWEWAQNPSEKDRASFMPEDLRPLKESPHLKILEGPCELFPGFHLVVSNGHTVGMQMVRIENQEATLFYCSDLMPTASHVPLPYIMGYDLYPLVTLEDKRRHLSRACEEGWIVALEHDPNLAAIRIKRGEKDFEVEESLQF